MSKTKKPTKEMKYFLLDDRDQLEAESDNLNDLYQYMIGCGGYDMPPFRVIKGYELLVFAEEEPAEIQYYAEDI